MADAWDRRVFPALVVALFVAAAGSFPALLAAQDEDQGALMDSEATPEQQEEAAPPVVVEEIVVTAQKRVQNIQEVPVSLSALDSEQLEMLTTGGVDVRFLSGRVPSLVIESSFGRAFPRFYIRGLGNTDFDLNASQPVSLVYDEEVLENPVLKGMPVWDLERTEVLRGPQGTLFGRNTPAGIVKFDSKKPTREKDGFARLSYGTYDTTDFRGAIGGPLSDTVSARFSALVQARSDWVDNRYQPGPERGLGGYTTAAFRLQFLWEPNDRFRGLLNLHSWDVDGTARIFRANIIEQGTNHLASGFHQDEVFHDGLNEQRIKSHGGTLKLEYDLGEATLTSVTGFETLDMYSRGDIDGGFGAVFAPPFGPGFIPFNSETADGIPDLDQFTQEVRVASNEGGRFNWLVGAFYFDESLKIDTFSYNSLGGGVQDGYAFQSQDAEAWALFGSVEYQPTDRWTLRGGLRYSNDQKDFAAERPQPTFLNTATVAPIRRNTDDSFTSWDLSATYEVSPQVNVYSRVATSFRAPSIQGRILFAPDPSGGTDPATSGVSVADREDILSGEVGVKSELFDRRLRLNLDVYRYQVDGQQIVAVGGQFNTATLLNADKTDGYGFEADIEIAPTSEWQVTLGLSNNHTEINDPNLTVAPCGGGCTILDPVDDPVAPTKVFVDGNSLPHAPEWIFNGILDYRKPVGNGVFLGTVDWAYYSEKHFFLYESEEFRDDSFEVGLRLGYVFAQGLYEVAVFGRNIFDEVVIRNGIDFDNLTGMTNDPAIWGLEFVRRF